MGASQARRSVNLVIEVTVLPAAKCLRRNLERVCHPILRPLQAQAAAGKQRLRLILHSHAVEIFFNISSFACPQIRMSHQPERLVHCY